MDRLDSWPKQAIRVVLPMLVSARPGEGPPGRLPTMTSVGLQSIAFT